MIETTITKDIIKDRKSAYELSPQELKMEYNPVLLDFKTSEDLPVKEGVINQDRALRTIDFGLNIKKEGYNLYISGEAGTGRNTHEIPFTSVVLNGHGSS